MADWRGEFLKRASFVLDLEAWLETSAPRGDDGHVYLRDAVLEAGHAMLGEAWTGQETLAAWHVPEPPFRLSYRPSEEEGALRQKRRRQMEATAGSLPPERELSEVEIEALDRQAAADRSAWEAERQANGGRLSRLLEVLKAFEDEARNGRLVTRLRLVKPRPGELRFFKPESPLIWDGGAIERLFHRCRARLWIPELRREDDAHLFISRESLNACKERLCSPGEETYSTGAPGRGTSRHLILAEFNRRLSAGEVLNAISREGAHLSKWLSEKHPKAAPAEPRTVENIIRASYRRAMSHKTA